MRNLVLLFIFIFSPLAFNVSGSIGKTKIDKIKELVQDTPVLKTLSEEEKLIEAFSNWKIAEATFYDPLDTTQTKENPDGKGTSGRIVGRGSIAMGSSFKEIISKEGTEVYIEIKNLNIQTPYGKGIFRIDDTMPGDYDTDDQIHIDFFHKDLDSKHKRLGRFDVKFRIIKIQKADS